MSKNKPAPAPAPAPDKKITLVGPPRPPGSKAAPAPVAPKQSHVVDESNIVSSHVAEQSVQQLLAWAAAQASTGFSAAPERTTAEIIAALRKSDKAWERFQNVRSKLFEANGRKLEQLAPAQVLDHLGIDCSAKFFCDGKGWAVAVDVTTNPEAVEKKEAAAVGRKAPVLQALGYQRVLVVEYHLDLSFEQLADEQRQVLVEQLAKPLRDEAHRVGYFVTHAYLTL